MNREEALQLAREFDPDAQVARLRAVEPPEMRRLRWLLAMQWQANTGVLLYRDDGEYSCNASGIDFRRDSPDDIEFKMHRYYQTRAKD